jgi:hypothetical protein
MFFCMIKSKNRFNLIHYEIFHSLVEQSIYVSKLQKILNQYMFGFLFGALVSLRRRIRELPFFVLVVLGCFLVLGFVMFAG